MAPPSTTPLAKMIKTSQPQRVRKNPRHDDPNAPGDSNAASDAELEAVRRVLLRENYLGRLRHLLAGATAETVISSPPEGFSEVMDVYREAT
eukprot:CAMPEP_0194292104 /NCGR_PEP_ID=MMETSP0169-20130528/44899_1 /TAXON_ID=218684 /ORGANISM="Corethron pennatum, Strain L29A3" /LENGTH=91 /DNA_ID=CAMNT_0039040175 /DNA_START=216 /DNA_END=488 /DNA_ORIENTATION=-